MAAIDTNNICLTWESLWRDCSKRLKSEKESLNAPQNPTAGETAGAEKVHSGRTKV
jgi:hypothetical protein